MTYTARESSNQDGAPIEGYRFTAPARTYDYTSSPDSVAISGITFTPVYIKRDATNVSPEGNGPNEIQIEMADDVELVTDFAFTTSPPSLTVEIFRSHTGLDTSLPENISRIWRGDVIGWNVKERIARLRSASLFGRLRARPVPNIYWQNLCNHVLYDARCNANGDVAQDGSSNGVANRVSTTVNNVISANAFAVPVSLIVDTFKAGKVLHVASGESRLIVANTASNVLINFPFTSLTSGDSIQLQRGCDHSFQTCKDKFDNTQNFGGFPYVPTRNPFTEGI